MALIAFILTDCAMKPHTETEDHLALVRSDSLTKEELTANYVPFCAAARVGFADDKGSICKGIVGDEKSITISGVIMMGKFPRPYTTEYTVGKSFTAPTLHDGNTHNPIAPVVTAIIIAKDEKDTTGIVNKFNELCASWGRELKMAEQVLEAEGEVIALCYDCNHPIHMDDGNCKGCGSWDWEDDDFFGAEYEMTMETLAFNSYPQNRFYESTV
jgi:hypothetical protein